MVRSIKRFIVFYFIGCFLIIASEVKSREGMDSIETRKEIERLKLLLETKINTDKQIAELNLSLADCYNKLNKTEEAYSFAMTVYTIARKNFYQKEIAGSLAILGEVSEKRGDMVSAANIYLQEILFAETFYDYTRLISLYEKANNALWHIGEYVSIMEICNKAIRLAEKSGNEKDLVRFIGLEGYIMIEQNEFHKADSLFEQCIVKSKILGKTDEMKAELGMGESKLRQFANVDARFHLRNALRLLNPDKQQERIKLIYGLISKSFLQQKDFDSAIIYAEKSIYYCQIPGCTPNQYDLAFYYINYGEIFFQVDKTDSALTNIRKGIKIAKAIQHKSHLKTAYLILSENYFRIGILDSAYLYLKLGNEIDKKISDVKSKFTILKLQSETDLRMAKNKYLESKESELELRLQKNIILWVSVSGFLAIALAFTVYRLRYRNKRNAEKIRVERELYLAMINGQDVERKRLAKDLHDGLGTLLSALKLNLENMDLTKTDWNEEQKKIYTNAVKLSEISIKEMRHIAHSLMPASLSQFGLAAALADLFEKINTSGKLKVFFDAPGLNKRFSENFEMSVYQIILEIVNNVLKHAGAKSLTVQIVKYTDTINIIVEDDGAGFNFNIEKLNDGMGIKNIFTRIRLLNGKIEIDTKPGRGTIIIMDIPAL